MLYLSSLKHGEPDENLHVGDGWLRERRSSGNFFSYMADNAIIKDTGSCGSVDTAGKYKGVIGIGLDRDVNRHIAVVHTKKAALLYRYASILGVGKRPHYLRNCAFVDFREKNIQLADRDSLDVQMQSQSLNVYDTVLVWDEYIFNNQPTVVCTLYDFLIEMCRYFEANIMRYGVVQFGSVVQKWCVRLKFAQTPEAQRFYSKMWLDVCSDYTGMLKGAVG